jgi:hypothetical protein
MPGPEGVDVAIFCSAGLAGAIVLPLLADPQVVRIAVVGDSVEAVDLCVAHAGVALVGDDAASLPTDEHVDDSHPDAGDGLFDLAGCAGLKLDENLAGDEALRWLIWGLGWPILRRNVAAREVPEALSKGPDPLATLPAAPWIGVQGPTGTELKP